MITVSQRTISLEISTPTNEHTERETGLHQNVDSATTNIVTQQQDTMVDPEISATTNPGKITFTQTNICNLKELGIEKPSTIRMNYKLILLQNNRN